MLLGIIGKVKENVFFLSLKNYKISGNENYYLLKTRQDKRVAKLDYLDTQ